MEGKFKMLKYIIASVLVVAMAFLLLSCKNDSPEKNLKKYEGKEAVVGCAFLGRAVCQADALTISDSVDYAFELNVNADTFLTALSIRAEAADENSIVNVKIQKWDTDLEKTQKKTAIFETDVAIDVIQYYEVAITDGLVGEGKYLVTLTAKDGDAEIMYSYAENRRSETFAVNMDKTYYIGNACSYDMIGFAAYNSYDKEVAVVSTQKTELTEGKTKVILLMGQSNATGTTYIKFLKNTVSEEKYAEYEKGYENILISNNVDGGTNDTDGFVPVKLGLGGETVRIGPELGLAEYLSNQYPDEKIYIIKASWSGAGLTANFNTEAGEYKWCIERIHKALKILEDEGVDFEIAALLWMQGETDAMGEDWSLDYANQERQFIANISEEVKDYLPKNGLIFEDAAISTTHHWLHYKVVNVAKQQVCQENVNYYYIDTVTEGLQCQHENDDPCHYDSKDALRLGEMFGETFVNAVRS